MSASRNVYHSIGSSLNLEVTNVRGRGASCLSFRLRYNSLAIYFFHHPSAQVQFFRAKCDYATPLRLRANFASCTNEHFIILFHAPAFPTTRLSPFRPKYRTARPHRFAPHVCKHIMLYSKLRTDKENWWILSVEKDVEQRTEPAPRAHSHTQACERGKGLTTRGRKHWGGEEEAARLYHRWGIVVARLPAFAKVIFWKMAGWLLGDPNRLISHHGLCKRTKHTENCDKTYIFHTWAIFW